MESIKSLLRDAQQVYHKRGLIGLASAGQGYIRKKLLLQAQGGTQGPYIMEKDWDNLIILDACRADVFEDCCTIDGEYTRIYSRGETTPRFFNENFLNRTCYDTVFVSGNANVSNLLPSLDIHYFEGVWGEETTPMWEDDREIVPPELVAKKTLEVHDKFPNKRLISHFVQPHPPFVVKDGEKVDNNSPYRSFSGAVEGEISAAEIRSVYRENVAYVLNFVEELVEKLPGKSVITSDHGELLGDSVPSSYKMLHPRHGPGKYHYYEYGHWTHLRLPELTRVPWLEVTCNERKKIQAADESVGYEFNKDHIEEQLQALGYK